MKKIVIVFTFSFIAAYAFSQITSVGISNEFKRISSFGSRQSGFEGLQTYSNHSVKGSQFFNEDWSEGSVISVNRDVISTNYLFLYDKVRQELFIRPKDTTYIILADKNQIASFIINSDRPHTFYQAYIYDPNQKGSFFEVVAKNDKYTLLKLIKTTFVKSNPNDLEKAKQGDFQDEFVDHITYYVYHDNKTEKINLNEHSIRKALKDEQSKVDSFFNLHSNNMIDDQLLINLINSLNS